MAGLQRLSQAPGAHKAMRVEYKPAHQCRGCERWYIEGERIDLWHKRYHGCPGDPYRRIRKRNNQFKPVTLSTTEIIEQACKRYAKALASLANQ